MQNTIASKPTLAAVDKPYRLYSHDLRQRFGARVYKVSIDAGFNCPNRDGTKGIGGCTFCDTTGSSSRSPVPQKAIVEQIRFNIERRRQRFKAQKFIAYFQSFTNTYADIERLTSLYDTAMTADPDVIGLAISTRPDCVDAEKLALIASYHKDNGGPAEYVSVEYGLQTIHDRTLAQLNRCETHQEFLDAFAITQELGIEHCIHVILGLPRESWEDHMATANALARLGVDGVKIHVLCAMEHTPLAKDYLEGRWVPWELDESIGLMCDFIERLRPECVLHRIAGNGHPQHVVAPVWLRKKAEIMARIDAEFERRGTRQGSRCLA